MHKIEVKSKEPNKLSVGANTEIYIDGKLAKMVKSFKYEVDARGVGVATIEYYANMNIQSNVQDIVAEGIILSEPTYQEMGDIKQKWTIDEEE